MGISAWGRRRGLLVVLISALCGLLVAGLALPFVGGLGLVVKAGSDTFLALPADLTIPAAAQRTRILAADGSPLASFYYQNRVSVPLARVPMVMRRALLDIEDSRFYDQGAVDLQAVARAALTDLVQGGAAQGASTITQQYVKNVLVQSGSTKAAKRAARADTLARKLREARYAVALEQRLTKDQILERYLNIVYFGDGAYGVAAAAEHYFSVPVDKLTLAQAALLAGLVQNPSRLNPSVNAEAAKARRDVVLAKMRELGDITAGQERAAAATPVRLRIKERGNGCEQSGAPFFCDYVLHQLLTDPKLGDTVDDRRNALLRGGLTVHTTLDPKVQRAAQRAVDHTVTPDNRVGAAAVVVEPGTGAVKAMAVNRGYGTGKGKTMVNYATGGQTGFQAGSTFKIFVLAAALQKGIPLDLTLDAPHTYTSPTFSDYVKGKGRQPYQVSNAGDSEAGRFTLTQATWLSVNTYYLQLEERTGVAAPAALAEKMGVRLFPDKKLSRFPSFFLGVNAVSPLAMAEAYATFAAHGMHCPAYGVGRITRRDGTAVPQAPHRCERVLDAHTADTVTSVLRGVIDGPDPLRTGRRASIGRPAAGKTGTTDNSGAAWFIGYTPQLATAVWVGDPRGAAYPLVDVSADGRHWPVVYGGDLPAIIWQRTMSAALAGTPVEGFPGPAPSAVLGARGGAPAPAPLPSRAATPPPPPRTGPHKKHGHPH